VHQSESECASKTRINEIEEARAFSALQNKSPSLSEQLPFKDEWDSYLSSDLISTDNPISYWWQSHGVLRVPALEILCAFKFCIS
jgi:hypothetical protein